MDIQDIAKSAGISATIISAIGAIIAIIKKLNNKRFHSSCCGKDMDVIVAVNSITEEEKKGTPKPSPTIHPIKHRGSSMEDIAV